MILVDSCGWIEFFTDGKLSQEFYNYLKNSAQIITPTIVIFEVFKKIKQERSDKHALVAIAQVNKTKVITLTDTIAISAAELSLAHNLPMADAIVYATAILNDAQVVTSDAHFKGLPQVIYLAEGR